MNTRHLQLVLPAILFALSSCISMDSGQPKDNPDPFARPNPEFPNSEYSKRREGWVVLGYTISRGGIVDDVHIRDSSGNNNFEDAALEGIQAWRFEPGEQREEAVIVSFLDGHDRVRLSDNFSTMYMKANELIDAEEFERAEELLAELKADEDLHPSELAYTFIMEGRIAGERGDRAEQLFLVRKAMLSNGRWLAPEHHREILHLAVALALDQEDLASALRDYEILTKTPAGGELGASLEGYIKSARIRAEADPALPQPFAVANFAVLVRPDSPKKFKAMPAHQGYSGARPQQRETRPSRGPRGGANKTKN